MGAAFRASDTPLYACKGVHIHLQHDPADIQCCLNHQSLLSRTNLRVVSTNPFTGGGVRMNCDAVAFAACIFSALAGAIVCCSELIGGCFPSHA